MCIRDRLQANILQLQEVIGLYHLENDMANGALTEQVVGIALQNTADIVKERPEPQRGANGAWN
eukprot:12312198-Alexandrium_andersonii.AAC.1